MDHFISYSDDSPLSQYATSESTSNEYNNISATDISNHDQVMLASSNPKKRSGRKKFQETRHPIYRGVRRRKNDKWVCEVREPTNNARIWLGTYPTAEMAARANDVAAIALRGRNACLNFADSAWRLPIPASSDTKDIQRAASLAAEAFRPPQNQKAAEASRPLQNEDADNNATDTSSEKKPLLGLQESGEFNYMDEEAIFNMHEFMNSLAHGMMLPPPQCVQSDECCGDDDMEGDLSLWSYTS